ncbi:MAG: nuclear transport factor 2 family protein, partial [Acidobacteriaceae bacterium]
MSIASEVRALEEQLLQTSFRRNRKAVAELLAEDFREFGSSSRIWNKQQILDQLESEPAFEATLQDFQTTEVAAGVVLATYRLTLRRRDAETTHSLRSSLWVRRDNRWRILFHQGTITTRSWSDFLKSGATASEEF